MGAHGVVGAGVWRARGEDLGTGGSIVRKLAQTGETCHTVHTSALIQAGTGCTFVDVNLAEVTSEALATLAGETIELVNACASVLAGTRQTVVSIQVTVLTNPTRLTVTPVTVDVISA